jgi:hypothetical protein
VHGLNPHCKGNSLAMWVNAISACP